MTAALKYISEILREPALYYLGIPLMIFALDLLGIFEVDSRTRYEKHIDSEELQALEDEEYRQNFLEE